MTDSNFKRAISKEDILVVLTNEEQKTSEVLRKLKDLEKGKRNKKYKTTTQGGLLKVLKKMHDAGEIEGNVERFGLWIWWKKKEE